MSISSLCSPVQPWNPEVRHHTAFGFLHPADFTPDDLAGFSLEAIHAELFRRQEKPECGTRGQASSYNTGIHVFALFLILGLSTLGESTMTSTGFTANSV